MAGPYRLQGEPEPLTAEGHVAAAKAALAEQDDHSPADPAHLSLGVSAVAHLLTVMTENELAAEARAALKSPAGQVPYTGVRPVSESNLNLAPAPWISDPETADHMMQALGGAIATAAGAGHVTWLVSPDGEIIAAIVPPTAVTDRLGPYSCTECGHIGQPEYWHPTSDHTDDPPEPEGSRLAERDAYIGTWSHQDVTRREPGQ